MRGLCALVLVNRLSSEVTEARAGRARGHPAPANQTIFNIQRSRVRQTWCDSQVLARSRAWVGGTPRSVSNTDTQPAVGQAAPGYRYSTVVLHPSQHLWNQELGFGSLSPPGQSYGHINISGSVLGVCKKPLLAGTASRSECEALNNLIQRRRG